MNAAARLLLMNRRRYGHTIDIQHTEHHRSVGSGSARMEQSLFVVRAKWSLASVPFNHASRRCADSRYPSRRLPAHSKPPGFPRCLVASAACPRVKKASNVAEIQNAPAAVGRRALSIIPYRFSRGENRVTIYTSD